MYMTNTQLIAQKLAQQSIPIQPCEVCGITVNVHRHHDDYSKPLQVRFLCPKHHKQAHPANTAMNKGTDYRHDYERPGQLRAYAGPVTRILPKGRLRLKTIANRRAAKISEEDLDFILSL